MQLTRFQANARNFCARQLVGARHKALQVHVVCKAHFGRAHAKDEALLPAVWDGELDLRGSD
jgi:hypothetical protein